MRGASWIRGQPREPHASRPARPASGTTTAAPRIDERFNGAKSGPLVAKLLIEDLPDEAVDRDRIEAYVGGDDHAGVDHLALRKLLQDAVEMALGVARLPADFEILVLQGDPRRVAEAEDAGDQALVHQLGLLEHLAVGGPAAPGGDDQPRRHLDAAADFDRVPGLIGLGPDEDVGQYVVAGDDAGHRLAHHPGLVEDVAEEFPILPVFSHAG